VASVDVNRFILALGVVAFGFPAVVAVLDLWFRRRGGPTVGQTVQAWSRRYPVFALAFAIVLGLLVGHFFWSTPEDCKITGPNAPVIQLPHNEPGCRMPDQPKD